MDLKIPYLRTITGIALGKRKEEDFHFFDTVTIHIEDDVNSEIVGRIMSKNQSNNTFDYLEKDGVLLKPLQIQNDEDRIWNYSKKNSPEQINEMLNKIFDFRKMYSSYMYMREKERVSFVKKQFEKHCLAYKKFPILNNDVNHIIEKKDVPEFKHIISDNKNERINKLINWSHKCTLKDGIMYVPCEIPSFNFYINNIKNIVNIKKEVKIIDYKKNENNFSINQYKEKFIGFGHFSKMNSFIKEGLFDFNNIYERDDKFLDTYNRILEKYDMEIYKPSLFVNPFLTVCNHDLKIALSRMLSYCHTIDSDLVMEGAELHKMLKLYDINDIDNGYIIKNQIKKISNMIQDIYIPDLSKIGYSHSELHDFIIFDKTISFSDKFDDENNIDKGFKVINGKFEFIENHEYKPISP